MREQDGGFAYLRSKMLETTPLSGGIEGKTYTTHFEDENGQDRVMVVKKFNSGLPKRYLDYVRSFGLDNDPEVRAFLDMDHDEKTKCIKTSTTAAYLREQGLPVLPIVKSVLTKDHSNSMDLELAEKAVKPPFVLMTSLQTEGEVYEFKSGSSMESAQNLAHEIGSHPDVLYDMVRDLAKLHSLGYCIDIYEVTDCLERHSPSSLWMFTKQGEVLKRWMVDIGNLTSIDRLRKNNIPMYDFFSEDLQDFLVFVDLYINPLLEEKNKFKLNDLDALYKKEYEIIRQKNRALK